VPGPRPPARPTRPWAALTGHAYSHTLRELMEFMGHSSLQATDRYVKLLPRPDEADPAERLNAYLRRRAAR
jgi:hypothetical protein